MKIRFNEGEMLSTLIFGSKLTMVFPEGISRSDLSEKTVPKGDWYLSIQVYDRWMSFQDVNDAHEINRLAALEHFLKAHNMGLVINDGLAIPTRACAGRWNLYAQFSVGKLYFDINPFKKLPPGTSFLLIEPCA